MSHHSPYAPTLPKQTPLSIVPANLERNRVCCCSGELTMLKSENSRHA